jgi:hypothetical protein
MAVKSAPTTVSVPPYFGVVAGAAPVGTAAPVGAVGALAQDAITRDSTIKPLANIQTIFFFTVISPPF